MANLASSGQLTLDDIIKNRTGAAGTDVSLKDESETFASGSEVDGSSDYNYYLTESSNAFAVLT